MRNQIISAFIVLISSVGCSDSTAPVGIAGKYVVVAFDVIPDETGHANRPIFPGSSILVLDSIRDTVILNSDYTYREVGAVWGRNWVDLSEYRINTRGTFTVDGSNITLIADSDATAKGGMGTLKKKKLSFERDSIQWTFAKQ